MPAHKSAPRIVIRIVSPYPTLAYEVGALLEESIGARVYTDLADEGYGLCVPEDFSAQETAAILRSIKPFSPPVELETSIGATGSACVELSLGRGIASEVPAIEYLSSTPEFAVRLSHEFHESGFASNFLGEAWYPVNLLSFGSDWGAFDRALLLWTLKRHGIVPSLRLRASGAVSRLLLQDPNVPSACSFLRLQTRCDSSSVLKTWTETGLSGFKVTVGSEAPKQKFRLELGPLSYPEFAKERVSLEKAITTWLCDRGVDLKRFPLQTKKGWSDPSEPVPPQMVLHLPIEAHEQGLLRPYAGDHPDRFDVILQTDAPEEVSGLRESLRKARFAVVVEELALAELGAGFTARWGVSESCPTQAEALKRNLEDFFLEHGLQDQHLRALPSGRKDTKVIFSLPVRAVKEGRVKIRPGLGFHLKLKLESRLGWEGLETVLRDWGFSRFQVEETGDGIFGAVTSDPRIQYGGAPRSLIEAIVKLVTNEGVLVHGEQVWNEGDHDIWIDLPAHPQGAKASEKSSDPTLDVKECSPADCGFAEDIQARPLRLIQGDEVVLGPWRLRKRKGIPDDHPHFPLARVEDFCLDSPTLRTLEFLAAAVSLREPVLLEGHTGTTKTSSIEYLASLLRQPLIIVNLNGMTDTQELIGKPWLAPDKGLEWRDGPVPIAMESGFWLCLDEGNLAGGNILERLNSVVGRCPSLVLSEHDGRRISGEGVHPDFRIFFTMNPAEFAGRSVLSPAWRDRFQGYRFCPQPGEREYYELLVYLVYGEQPLVQTIEGTWAQAQSCGTPAFESLQPLPDFKVRLAALARLHASLSKLTGQDADSSATLAVQKKEKHVFSRRGLLALLDFLKKRIDVEKDSGGVERLIREAVDHVYVQRMASDADRATVWDLVSATGVCGDLSQQTQSSDETDDRGKG